MCNDYYKGDFYGVLRIYNRGILFGLGGVCSLGRYFIGKDF